ncbi:hypothetical protein D3C78_609390 [compost metagenome]
MAEQPDHETHGELGDDAEDIEIHRDVEQRHHQEQLRDAQFQEAQQHHAEDRRDHHEQCVKDVVGGNHPRTLVLRGARLDQCIQRHDIEAAEHTQAENRPQHPPGLADAQYRQPVVRRGRRQDLAGVPPPEQAEQAQAEGAERHQADFHLVPAHALAQQRTDGDAHREQGKDQGHHGLVAVQPLLGVTGDLRQVHRADEPEP